MRIAILFVFLQLNLVNYAIADVRSVQMVAPEGNPTIEAITKALNSGDVATLSLYFGSKVQIAIGDTENMYDKAKAADALKSFFGAKKTKGYSSMHTGRNKDSADQYMIGNLSTEAGAYRVYIYLKVSGASQTIQEIRFDQ